MSTLGANAELPQEFIDQYNIHEYTDVSVEVIDGNGNAATNTQTIKSILSLAAVYIEQDFTKYGSALDGILRIVFIKIIVPNYMIQHILLV